MRLHTTTVLSLSALAVLTLAGCSHGSAVSSGPMSSPTVPVHSNGESAPGLAPLSATALAMRLLDESDLGGGYTHTPQRPARRDDVAVVGCPALAKLGGDAATGTSLAFPRKAKASFTCDPDRQRPGDRLGRAGARGRQPGEGASQGQGRPLTVTAPFGAPPPWQRGTDACRPASTTGVPLHTAPSPAEASLRLPRSTSAGRLSVRTGALW